MIPILFVGEDGPLARATRDACAAHGLEVRAGLDVDLGDRAAVAASIDDAEQLVLFRPPRGAVPEATLVRVLGDAVGMGVEQVVLVGQGASRLDDYLRDAAVEWTILRTTLLCQALAETCRHDIVADDRLYLPAGDARAAFVDARDVGEVVAVVLEAAEAHDRTVHVLTGPTTFSFGDVARALTVASGRAIRYQPASTLGYVLHLRGLGLSTQQVIDRALPYLRLRWRQGDVVDHALARLLGRPGRSVVDYVMEHGPLWRLDAPPRPAPRPAVARA